MNPDLTLGIRTKPGDPAGRAFEPPLRAAANAPVLIEVYDQLVGGELLAAAGRLGTFPICFPLARRSRRHWLASSMPALRGTIRTTSSIRRQHHFKGRALSMLFLFYWRSASAMAPTRSRGWIRIKFPCPAHRGRHGERASAAAPLNEGCDQADRTAPKCWRQVDRERSYLCHPFWIHSAQPHRGTYPRIMAQPPLLPRVIWNSSHHVDPCRAEQLEALR